MSLSIDLTIQKRLNGLENDLAFGAHISLKSSFDALLFPKNADQVHLVAKDLDGVNTLKDSLFPPFFEEVSMGFTHVRIILL
jgi:hypothetical protein